MRRILITMIAISSAIAASAQFNLVGPANNTTLTVEGIGATPVNINWTSQNTLTGSIAYTWHLDALTGDFTSPIISVPSNNMGADTNLTLNLETINAVLAGAGVAIGGTAPLKWTVTASNGTSTIVSPDTFNITLTRGVTASAYDLVFPTNGFAATVEGDGSTQLDIRWQSSGAGVTYAWLLDLATGDFSNPVVGPLTSNNMGMDTVLTLDFATIDAVLAGAGLTNGQTANLKWRVHAYAGSDSLPSTSEFTIDLTKGVILNAFDLVFPTNGFAATIEGKGSNELDITWNSAGSGATYEWALDLATGDFSNPVVGPLPSNNMGMDTVLTLDFATINSVLAGAGLNIGQTANLKWRVTAKAGAGMKMGNSDFTLDLTRGSIIEPFILVFPADGFAATIDNDSTQEITITWMNAGEGATYKWFLDLATGDYSNAIVNGLASNNMGMDTALTLKFSTIYSVLEGAGVPTGGTANLKWKVHSYAGTDSIPSNDYTIDLTRGVSTSINVRNLDEAITLWPNPVNGSRSLNVDGLNADVTVRLINMTGQEVLTTNLEAASSNAIDLSGVKEGVYLIRLDGENVQVTRRIILE